VAPNSDQAIRPERAFEDGLLSPRICATDLEGTKVQRYKGAPNRDCRQ
jgi:hypothetical protein